MIIEKNKTALITGATSGIGAAFARRFAKEGYNLIVTGRRKEKINSLAKELREEFNISVDVFIVELSSMNNVEFLIKKIKNRDISVLVNNAGFATKGKFADENLNVQEQMINLHIICAMKLIHSILPNMIKKKNGTIINLSSQSAFLVMPKNAAYSGTKAFLNAFSESIYLEVKDSGVKVQALCPGFVISDFHEKMGSPKANHKNKGIIRWMTPEKVVNISLENLKKGKVICKPGFFENLGMNLLNFLPKIIYYKIATNFCK
ncbi:SDR family oxidoreductase [Clostridium sp. JN-1]|uniref:SDR family NAD(P)-dependent oxidoreductase n=1 Tax=Clostridium sp. JN-1 TaxID=2483110 RepID=UPI0016807B06|nr:SDR family oxidoreductase [Clostridium sp. JN-1]